MDIADGAAPVASRDARAQLVSSGGVKVRGQILLDVRAHGLRHALDGAGREGASPHGWLAAFGADGLGGQLGPAAAALCAKVGDEDIVPAPWPLDLKRRSQLLRKGLQLGRARVAWQVVTDVGGDAEGDA